MLYKYLGIDGFTSTIRNHSLKFSSINEWRKGKSNDVNENFIAGCIEEENQFDEMMNSFKEMELSVQEIYLWMYYICLYSYQTFASCFSYTDENQEYMWREFSKGESVCICFKDNLFDALKKINHVSSNSMVYDFKMDKVDYCDCLPDIKDTLTNISDAEIYKRLAYFSKLKCPYEKEKEARIILTEYDYIKTQLISQLIPHTKDYNFSFSDIKSFITSKMGIDILDDKPRFLSFPLISIDHVTGSPYNSAENNVYVKTLCGEHEIVFV